MMFKLILVAIVAGAHGFHYYGHEYDRTPLGDAIDKTSLKLLKEAYSSGQEKSVVSSPLGVMLLLSLYNDGAGEKTREEISRILGGGDYTQLVNSYSGLSRHFSEMNPDFLTVANKIYVGNKYVLDDKFSSTARLYNSEFDVIDFKDPGKAADVINQWADEKTQGNIKTPVSKDIIDPKAAAAIFNVMFFKGNWHVPFNASETEDKDFHVDSKTTVKKPTMKLAKPLFYGENKDLGARFIELPYKEDKFRMVVVLPDEVEGLPSVLNKAAEKGLLEDIFNMHPVNREVILEIPRFEVKSSLDLNTLLPEIGVSALFTEPAPGIVKDDTVVVDKAFQEAFIKVNEEGATAGAFTGAILIPSSYPPRIPESIIFKADHPFLYFILSEDIILFAGTFSG